ncbi:WG repeat-containing protein [Psychrobacter sp. I-STPA10]|uniref:WG repeat-containing protein n=1 Tax=Psychrobacter sp. I-STPA10 TaxID=2585769 RepID=UPI001E35815D|nr:WG repeat-containing protein [Psychrobacter sp. I-STPA10]
MKPIYLALTLSIAALIGCSDRKDTADNTAASNDEQGNIETVATTDNICVTPEVEGYEKVGCLRDGLAGVISRNEAEPYTLSNRIGYIDKDGTLVIPFEYDGLMAGEGGEEIAFNDFSEGLVAVSKNDKYGFINTKGEMIIPLEYELARSFSDGLAVVSKDGFYGAIDKTGKVVIPFEYEQLNDFNDGFASVAGVNEEGNYQYGLIDKANKAVIPFMYDEMGNFSEGLLAVKKNDKWGYVDKTNKPVIALNLPYEQVNDFSNGLAAVFDYIENSDNMKYGYIDKKGELVIPMNFTREYWMSSNGIIDFSGGIAVVQDKDGRSFCIDTKGTEIACPQGIGTAINNTDDDANNYADEANGEETSASLTNNATGNIKFANITNYLALKPNQKWTWEQLAALPDVQEWDNKTAKIDANTPNNPIYSILAVLNNTSTMMVYGSQQQPNLVLLRSGQGVMEDDTLSGVSYLDDFFNSEDLTRIPSNCDVDSIFEQKFYKWQKDGAKPLYVYAVTAAGNAGTNTEYGIAESLDEFFKPKYNDIYLELQSIDNNYDDVVCTFSE